MKINNSPRKPGIYAQWFTIIGFNKQGLPCLFHVYEYQADTFEKAIEFFNIHWPDCTGLEIRCSEPYDTNLALCA